MKSKKLSITLGLLIVMVMAMSACSVEVERNTDGSLKVESSMTEASLQAELEAAIADSQMQDFVADMRDGYITVTATRQRPGSDQTDDVSFRLDLGVADGHLTATISEFKLNGLPVNEERVTTWNERIADKLERAGQSNANSSLQSVTIGQDTLTMVWRIETARSRGS